MARDQNIEKFRDDPDTSIMVSSLRAGGTGLNLTMATKCILVDLWWNEAVEQQVKHDPSSLSLGCDVTNELTPFLKGIL